jgi:hypothetical protein
MLLGRVTRLGEFFAYRAIVFFGRLFEKITELAQILGQLSSPYRVCIHFDKILNVPNFKRLFLPTHLVTLLSMLTLKAPTSFISGIDS